jgi:hypothetical protein
MHQGRKQLSVRGGCRRKTGLYGRGLVLSMLWIIELALLAQREQGRLEYCGL